MEKYSSLEDKIGTAVMTAIGCSGTAFFVAAGIALGYGAVKTEGTLRALSAAGALGSIGAAGAMLRQTYYFAKKYL